MADCCTPKDGSRYDLAVVGAGSAGFSAAITAAEAGARVALVGSGVIGGTCVNVGCVPSKALIRAVEPLHQARAAQRFNGIHAEARLTDWQALVDQKRALVEELRQAKYVDLLPAYGGIDYLEGTARFDDAGNVLVDGEPLAARKAIIATGARPAEPSIREALTRYLENEGIRFVSHIVYERIERTAAGVRLTVTQDGEPAELEAEAVLAAAGRQPNTEALGLEAAGIATDGRGAIRVDANMRTTHPAIYAAGDVTGRDLFVNMAAHGAKLAALNALNGDRHSYDDTAMPSVVFTDPTVASIGLTEARAREAGIDVETSTIGLEHVPRALAARDTRGLIKLVAEEGTGRLLGAHILAPEGADSIQTAALAIKAGISVEELGATIFPYLTTVEGLKLAAQAFGKDVAKLSCCAG